MRNSQFCGRTRREFLHEIGGGFGSVALAGMLGGDAFASTPPVDPMAPKEPHFPAKAKSVIFLFMYGGPSHIDTFDRKPALAGRDNQTANVKTFGRAGKRNASRIVEPRWKFRPYGQCGKWVSDLFPHLGQRVDDIAFVHSMTADSPIHGSAMLMMNSGRVNGGFPCLGSWATYGLGTVNRDLPGFVVMLDRTGGPISGAKNWSCGFMPASYQGTTIRTQGAPVLDLQPPPGVTRALQRDFLDELAVRNREHAAVRPGQTDLAARVASYELAFRMQQSAPEAVDFAKETAETKKLYGIDQDRTRDFGTKCLLARRLVERGVRFVQIYSGGAHNDDNWDAHNDIAKNHNKHAGDTDLPVAGLLADLKRRGLLDSTLVVWGGEFGRQPTAEYATGTGRDHNSYGFTMWLAGGGVKGGTSYGATDELGAVATENPCHVKRLHATILHQLGFDPNRLSFRHQGLEQKLVGVENVAPIKEILA